MSDCNCKCKKVLISGNVRLTPDAEPYKSGKIEKIDLEKDIFVCTKYCPECDTITKLWSE